MHYLELDRIRFPVQDATYTRYSDGTVSFSIDCGESDALLQGHRLWGRTPRLYADGSALPLTPREGIKTIALASMPEPHLLTLCVFEHEDLVSCSGSIDDRGDPVAITLSGVATIMGKQTSFAVSAEARRVSP
jgi:hypothetical protein